MMHQNDEDGDGKPGVKPKANKPPSPDSPLRVWMPECMVLQAEPNLIEEWEDIVRRKEGKKKGKAIARSTISDCQKDAHEPKQSQHRKSQNAKKSPLPVTLQEGEEDSDSRGSIIQEELKKHGTATDPEARKQLLKELFPVPRAGPSNAFRAQECLVWNATSSGPDFQDLLSGDENKVRSYVYIAIAH
jgi:hypothetical protein